MALTRDIYLKMIEVNCNVTTGEKSSWLLNIDKLKICFRQHFTNC